MKTTIRNMESDDYERCYALWLATKGIGLTDDDTRERVEVYLRFNARLSFVALHGDDIVGTILCGHDGRRGMIRHLAVRDDFRGRGIAKKLVELSVSELRADGILKCNVCVEDSNAAGLAFWQKLGAKLLHYDWRTLQFHTNNEPLA